MKVQPFFLILLLVQNYKKSCIIICNRLKNHRMVEAERNFWRSPGPTPCSRRVIYTSFPQSRFRKNKRKKHPQNFTEYTSFFLNAKSYLFVVCQFLFFLDLMFLSLLTQDKVFMKLEARVLLCTSNKKKGFFFKGI